MRRLFVIFLALLFPLNVLALSMSVSSMTFPSTSFPSTSFPSAHPGVAASPDALAALPDLAVDDIVFDIDPDEPPAGMDFHDTVHGAVRQPAAFPLERAATLPLPPRRGLDPLPPIKPPPSA
ncbi:hypothetical protein [Pseudoduganella lutea]|uniref:Secreted protein n=1 Tax=Pseudoduganella lutea TaxID=321985 RepID=A0A4P6L232_9BURK|nr:hypothetical protein [Pseudoduganella lutea]QBE65441.1 hypothetical protein EWM63_22645 [Pseudoduganella lutea]